MQNKIEAITQLQEICEAEKKFNLKLNLDMITERDNDEFDFFHYDSKQLIGYLGLYPFGKKFELCGMVHPQYRRKGIFTKLLEKAKPLLVQAEEVLLNTPESSISGKAFIQSLPCQYAFSEFQMKWNQRTKGKNTANLTLKKATEIDIPFIQKLDMLCFDLTEEEALSFANIRLNAKNDTIYLILDGTEEVGKIRLQLQEAELWIYGFAVHPDYQGRGIGSQVLNQIIRNEGKQYSIHLEVAAKNAHALRLYQSCGFEVYGEQAYYKFDRKI